MKYRLLFLLSFTVSVGMAQYTETINSKKPGFSESPFGVGTKVYQIESSYFRQYDETPAYYTLQKSRGIDLMLKTGLFWEKFEVSADFAYQKDDVLYSVSTGNTFTKKGFSRFLIGGKYLIYMPKFKDPSKEIRSWKAKMAFDWHRLIPSVGVYAGLNLNVLGIAYKAPSISPKAAILLQNDFTEDLVLVTNLVGDYLTISSQRELGYIATLTYTIVPKFSLFIEHQGVFNPVKNHFDIGGGGAYLFNKDFQIGLNVRTQTQYQYFDIYAGLGLSYRIDHHKDKVIRQKLSSDGSGRVQYKKEGFFKSLFKRKSRRAKRPKVRTPKKRRIRKKRTKRKRRDRRRGRRE